MARKAYLRKDRYYKKAKESGFRSRAAYKLVELNQKFRLLKPGMAIIDLGCSPGSWLQVISQEVGPTGTIIGVDLEPVTAPAKNVSLIQGDIREERTKQMILASLGRKVDLVVSDMSPNLSGIKFQDQYESYELAGHALGICKLCLRENGGLVVKVFPGEETEPLKRELETQFEQVKMFIPDSTRKSSTEVYIVSRGYKPFPN